MRSALEAWRRTGQNTRMHALFQRCLPLLCAACLLFPGLLQAADAMTTHASRQAADGPGLQQAFNAKFADYLRADSQTPLPLPAIAKADWPGLTGGLQLARVFVEADRYYLAKLFTFTCYQGADGRYYLDVKGGFWGMDQLYYGPFDAADFY